MEQAGQRAKEARFLRNSQWWEGVGLLEQGQSVPGICINLYFFGRFSVEIDVEMRPQIQNFLK